MKEMMDLFEDITEEIESADHYAEEGLHCRATDPDKSNAFMEISKQKMANVEKIHEMAKKKMKKIKDAGAEIPAEMQNLYDWQLKKMTKRMAKVKNMYDMFK